VPTPEPITSSGIPRPLPPGPAAPPAAAQEPARWQPPAEAEGPILTPPR
jgi:hypothetical protein